MYIEVTATTATAEPILIVWLYLLAHCTATHKFVQ